ncbi:hypothetical protein A1O1_03963 [Capronia coronata CBS 617.96]|uniref:Uncharacterized protein n=1 Tax=Capronia coronata CBS 617.96 TaxID=1182541 RepID=W9YEC8_9EURO|nr:uncharacterized protein A1O1_03963 [Capronia coronata CBS 617.96]EXJ90858.1 hypothetical protein A1O1_03963 [Capronia coronata CBS 617.96]
MPVTYADPMDYSSAAMTEGFANPNYALISTSSASRRYPGSTGTTYSSGSYSDGDDFLMTTSSAINCPSLSASDSTYNMPLMSSMVGYDSDPTYEFLTDEVLSGTGTSNLNYHGQGQTQDLLQSSYIATDPGMYTSGMMNNFFSADLSWQNRVLTPPPEDYVRDNLPHHFLSVQDYQPELCQDDQDLAAFEINAISKSPSYRSGFPLPLHIATLR